MGLKVPIGDRDQYFDPAWKSVVLRLPERDGPREFEVNVDKPSFWNTTCHELISKEIKDWLSSLGHVPWPKRKPPKVLVQPLDDRTFALLGIDA